MTIGRQDGQILPLSLICLSCLALFLAMMINVGRLVLQKEDTRVRTDAVAYSAGVDYARALNLLSVSNKLLAGSALLKTAATLVPGIGGLAAVAPGPSDIQTAQDIVAGLTAFPGAPILVELDAIQIGRQNGLTILLSWNESEDSKPTLLPGFNLRRRYLSELVTGMADWAKGVLEGAPGNETYTYRDKATGKTVVVGGTQVNQETYGRKSGRRQKVYRAVNSSGRSVFVKRTPGSKDVPWDIAETGPHNLTVHSLSDPVEGSAGFLGTSMKALPSLISVAKVEVGGGGMEMFDPGAASFGVYLVSP